MGFPFAQLRGQFQFHRHTTAGRQHPSARRPAAWRWERQKTVFPASFAKHLPEPLVGCPRDQWPLAYAAKRTHFRYRDRRIETDLWAILFLPSRANQQRYTPEHAMCEPWLMLS